MGVMALKILRMEVGSLGTNCYIVWCEETLEGIVIDPGGDAPDILALVNREKIKVKGIVNTHGHADHIMANARIKAATSAPIMIHHDDQHMLTSGHRNLSIFMGESIASSPADALLRDGDRIEFGKCSLQVIHTPGHTPGGICLKGDGVLFSGDTLFAESIGRTDLPGGSYSQLILSIKEKLLVLPDDTRVLPGHGPETTIGWERRMNPFIQ